MDILDQANIFLPLPILPVIEDVGWWQGGDGSPRNQPYRNRFARQHCLQDYQALARLAQKIGARIPLGMVMGEWDRTNYLQNVAGATWMGRAWNNSLNQGPWLDEAASYLREQRDHLELALHGLCHEFWEDGQMQRSEFHDKNGLMRPRAIVKHHLQAFGVLLEQNGFSSFPRLFIPPALYHSFGNGQASIQALLHGLGIDYVTTRFAKAYRFSPPAHPKITWECGVGLLERGLSPVKWDQVAASPAWEDTNPILPLHWSNLLHLDPKLNPLVVDGWANLLLDRANSLGRIMAEDLASCWRQAAAAYLAKVDVKPGRIAIDLSAIPDLPCFRGWFWLKIAGRQQPAWDCSGAKVLSLSSGQQGVTLKLLPDSPQGRVEVFALGAGQSVATEQ